MNKLRDKQIESIYRDQRFDSVLELLKELSTIDLEVSCKGENEFQTIWNIAFREGRIQAYKDFIKELDKRLENAN